MKKIKKLGLIILLIGIMGCTACGKEEEKQVEITFIHGWGSTEEDHEAMRNIYEDFELQNPEIRLNMIAMPSPTDVVGKVGDLLTVGEIPDIIFTAGDGRESIYKFMVEKKYALDLMPVLEQNKELKESISPIALNYWTTDEGELYTVSDVLMISGGYWYNRDIFSAVGIKELPRTRKEWIEACVMIREYGYQNEWDLEPIVLDSNHAVYLTDAILADENPQMLKDMEKSDVDVYSLSFRRVLTELEKITQVSDVVHSFNYRDTLADFNHRQTAMYINGIWAAPMIDQQLNVSYAPLPSEDGTGVAAISSGVGYILGNTGNKEKIDASIKFLTYMMSEEVAERILKETGQIPQHPKIEITEEAAGKRLYEAVQQIKQAGRMIEVPANIWGTAKKDVYGDNVILYLDKKITLEKLQAEIEK